jgi:hypothetical protein
MTLYHPKSGKFFGRTASPAPIILEHNTAQNPNQVSLPEHKRTIDALFLAEIESLNEGDYLLAVNMTILDSYVSHGVNPYCHLGYFTAELPCLK